MHNFNCFWGDKFSSFNSFVLPLNAAGPAANGTRFFLGTGYGKHYFFEPYLLFFFIGQNRDLLQPLCLTVNGMLISSTQLC
ncbi:MAG: hypothetical protein BGO55_08710 [Sphingobacteriales bacterium 50-39]|nr:MAG: hypothetical protein BGO55_08710 [Sphingobacteriales bacterium 50-39]